MNVVSLARYALAVLALSSLVACEHELGPDDPGLELDFSGDDAFEDEGSLTVSSECSKDAILARAPNDERLWALAIAHRWIDLGVTYNRGGTFEGHRRDCSGFVSMAWGLGKPGPATAMLEPFSDHPQTFEIPLDALLPGDAVNRRTRQRLPGGGTVGHIRLFGGWINQAEGTHCILEYYSTGKVGRAVKGTRADLVDYIGLRRQGLSTTPRAGQPTTTPPPSPPPPSTAHTPGCGVMNQGEVLLPQQSKWSCDGRFQLAHQGDGNVVLYQGGLSLWSSQTAGQATSQLVMQGDGNFVLYRQNGQAAWHTRTNGNSTAALVVQDDGNVVIYGPNWRVLWQSQTGGR
jgi:hypothetical protein